MNVQIDNHTHRPLIGIPTWSDSSVEYAGVPLYAINQSYVNALTAAGAIPYLIPLNLDDETLRGIFNRLDGLFLSGGTDINPIHFGEAETGTEGALMRYVMKLNSSWPAGLWQTISPCWAYVAACSYSM